MNNRQNGRRRGRGGQQTRNGQPGGGPNNNGSRLDNRARGNAAQLLEKYKTLARDAQMQGDRVNTEYYLQFADHYFRVLNENRARFEEQRGRRDDFEGGEGDGSDPRYQSRDDGGDDNWDDGDGGDMQPEPAPARQEPVRAERQFRPRREERAQPQQSEANGESPREQGREQGRDQGREQPREQAASREPREPREPREQAAPRERRTGNREPREPSSGGNGYMAGPDLANEESAPARIEIDLPPSISGGEPQVEAAEGEAEAAPKRRRTRRPRAETASAEA